MRASNQLTAIRVAKLSEPGRYGDGGGLYLQVSASLTKSWLFRFMRNGRAREMGLGPVPLIGLADARQRAIDARRLLLEGKDPIDERRALAAADRSLEASRLKFLDATEQYISTHEPSWKNPKHRQQWRNTLETYAYPVCGDLTVGEVTTAVVLKIIEPIWNTKPETASRIRGRIEVILDWATIRGYRTGDNPARWKGHLNALLPSPRKVRPVRHHPALPYRELPAFMALLREAAGTSPRALEFTILTCARTSETTGAVRCEIDKTLGAWVVPSSRMKAKKEHRVPLCARASELATRNVESDLLFSINGEGLSENAMLEVLARMGYSHITVHGFRSTFRDWVAECTSYPGDMAEMALAHTVSDEVEAAYRRGDMFEKRRRLMRDWERYCLSLIHI